MKKRNTTSHSQKDTEVKGTSTENNWNLCNRQLKHHSEQRIGSKINLNCSVIIEVCRLPPAELNATAEASRAFSCLVFSPLWGMLTYISMALVVPAPSRVAVSPHSYGAQRFLEDGGRSPKRVRWWGPTERGAMQRWLAGQPWSHGSAMSLALAGRAGPRHIGGHGGTEEGGQVSASVCAWGNSRRSTGKGRREATALGGRSSFADSS